VLPQDSGPGHKRRSFPGLAMFEKCMSSRDISTYLVGAKRISRDIDTYVAGVERMSRDVDTYVNTYTYIVGF